MYVEEQSELVKGTQLHLVLRYYYCSLLKLALISIPSAYYILTLYALGVCGSHVSCRQSTDLLGACDLHELCRQSTDGLGACCLHELCKKITDALRACRSRVDVL